MSLIGSHAIAVGSAAYPFPTGLFPMIGLDGKHYGSAGNSNSGGTAVIGCYETDSIVTSITNSQWQTDLTGTYGGVTLTLSGTYNFTFGYTIPCYGTPYFYLLGCQLQGGNDNNVGVRYKIVNSTTVVPDGVFQYITAFHGQALFSGYVWGSTVIGTNLYAIIDAGIAGFSVDERIWQIKLPLAGSYQDLTPGSWSFLCTDQTPAVSWGEVRISGDSRAYANTVSIALNSDGTQQMYMYYGVPEAAHASLPGPIMYTWQSSVPGICSAKSDVSSNFGIPFADSGLNLAGATGTSLDDYTSPTIDNTLNEIWFGRSFSDSVQQGRYRRFSRNPMTNSISSVGTAVFTAALIVVSGQAEQIQFWRSGNDINTVYRDSGSLITYGFSLPPADRRITSVRWY